MSAAPSLKITVEDLLRNDDWRLMFHGTAKEIDSFTEEGVGQGGDRNSALGVFLAEWPDAAGEYGHTAAHRGEGAEASVLAVLAPSLSPTNMPDYYEFFGLDENGRQARDHARFAAMRQEFITAGHDIVDYEDGEGPIAVALHPERLIVVARLTLDQAGQLRERMQKLRDPFSGLARYEVLQEVLAPKSAPSMVI